MTEVRLATRADYNDYIALADRVFQNECVDVAFAEDIPKVYAPDVDSARFQRIVLEDGAVRALIAVLPGTLHTVCGDLSTGYVGTVSVAPESRGRGYMKRLMADWIAAEKERGCDLLLLGGQRQRYGYFGFAQGGECFTFTVSRRSVRHGLRDVDASGVSFYEILPGTAEEKAADALRKVQAAYYDRDWCGFAVACRSYRHVPVAALEQGRVIGYLVMKQDDPADVCECFAADSEALDRLLKAWLAENKLNHCEVQVPAWDRAALTHLRAWAEDLSVSPSLMIRVLDYPHVVSALLRLKSRWTALTDGTASFCLEGRPFTVTVRNNEVTVTEGGENVTDLSAREAAALLFEPFPMEGLPERFGNWFPLPLSCAEPDNF